MKKFLKVMKWLGIGIAIIIIGFVVFVLSASNRKYDAPYPEITASPDSSIIARGEYLAYGPAHCVDCHSPMSYFERKLNGEKVPLSGGMDFILPPGNIYAPNITPDPETGRIALWPQDVFIARFRAGAAIPGTPMPWGPYKTMSDIDLIAIYKYLHSLDPVKQSTPVGIQEGDPM